MGKKSKVYAKLTPKQKQEHLKMLENAVVNALANLAHWESSLRQLREEMK